jgi:uncharacterized membrane protein HdeD (DUF308 family)
MSVIMVRHWWLLALRAAAAILFGLLSATDRFGSVTALLALFTVLAAIDVGCHVTLARASRRRFVPWRWPLVEAVPGALVVLVVLCGPALSDSALSWLVVIWAVGQGGLELAGAWRQRDAGVDRLRITQAIWAIGFAAWAVLDPGPGNLTAVTWLGTFVTGAGVVLAFRAAGLRSTPAGRELVGVWRCPDWLARRQLLRVLRSRFRLAVWPAARTRQNPRAR